jgi:hypothetical protein
MFSKGTKVLFRLVSTELLEGDFYTCAQYQRDTKLPKRALLTEKRKHTSGPLTPIPANNLRHKHKKDG